ncbi:MAG: Mu-like prophage major head subunit gpT family protein [Gammaproteobacteria bacterium]
MLFTPATLQAMQKGFSTLFQQSYLSDNVPIQWDKLAERIDTPGTEINLYGWMAEIPQFRKWIGPRRASRLASRTYSLKNENYEFSYSVGRDDIKYDRLGIYNTHATRAGQAARVIWDQVLMTAMKTGKTVKCFDGQFFYDTDHPVDPEAVGGSTFVNLRTTFDLTIDNFNTAYGAMATLKDANGEPMMVRPNILACNSKMRKKALDVLQASLILKVVQNVAASENVAAAAISNVLAGDCTLMVDDRIEDNVWYLHHTVFMRPFIVQVETPPTGLEMRVNPEDPHVWENNEFLFGSRATGAAGYTLPHLSVRCEV